VSNVKEDAIQNRQIIYTAEEEINSVNRYVEPLPIQMDTYKYREGENGLVMVSEYIKFGRDQ
jgi:hypothetical protein